MCTRATQVFVMPTVATIIREWRSFRSTRVELRPLFESGATKREQRLIERIQ